MLEVFKPLPVVREVFREQTLPEGARALPRDSVVLGWEERRRGR